jgi:hypothetical protein
MHGLQWDCSLIPATTRDKVIKEKKENFLRTYKLKMLKRIRSGGKKKRVKMNAEE